MGRRLRYFPSGSLVEITCRTVQSRFLLRPTPLVNDLTTGVLARAARIHGVEVHAFIFLSNHYHLLVTTRDAQVLAAFMTYLNSNLAREIGRSVGWREKFWGSRYHAILVSNEEASQVDRLHYLLSHGCKENLVQRPRDWPGATSLFALMSGEPVVGSWFDRTLEGRAARRGKILPRETFVSREGLILTSLPCWKHLSPEIHRQRIAKIIEAIETANRIRIRDSGEAPLGLDCLQHQDPHQQANRSKRRPAPLIHAASKAIRQDFQERYRNFCNAYRCAAEKWSSGAENALDLFPEGSFPPPAPFVWSRASG